MKLQAAKTGLQRPENSRRQNKLIEGEKKKEKPPAEEFRNLLVHLRRNWPKRRVCESK